MRYDTEHRQRTHEKVVREAASAIRLHGPDKIGVATLMSNAGLTHGGFYAHFKSKDALIAEAITQMFDERCEAFQKIMTGVEPAKGLSKYIDLYLSTLHLNHRDRGCPVAALAGDLARMPAGARERFEAGLQRTTDLIAHVLKTLDKPQPEELAAAVLSEMVGAVMIARAVSTRALSKRTLETARASIKSRIGLDTKSTPNQ